MNKLLNSCSCGRCGKPVADHNVIETTCDRWYAELEQLLAAPDPRVHKERIAFLVFLIQTAEKFTPDGVAALTHIVDMS
jgi:hypothetical protein